MKHLGCAICVSLIVTAAPALAQDDLSRWRYFKVIKLDTTASGAKVKGDVKGFPVPVVLDATNFDFASAKSKGEDLRFATMEGTALPFEIEFWDATAKLAAVWVKVDVKGNATQNIKMSWGDPAATSASDSKAVFDVKEGFAGVWHLNDPGSTTAGGYKDATANAADATGGAGMTNTKDVSALIGIGSSFGGASNQYIQINDNNSLDISATGRTRSARWRRCPGSCCR